MLEKEVDTMNFAPVEGFGKKKKNRSIPYILHYSFARILLIRLSVIMKPYQNTICDILIFSGVFSFKIASPYSLRYWRILYNCN